MNILKTFGYGCIGFGIGMAEGLKWNYDMIQKHWWWIFITVLEIITIPLKLVLLVPAMIACACSKRFKNWITEHFNDIVD